MSAEHCESCDPSFSCWSAPENCRKPDSRAHCAVANGSALSLAAIRHHADWAADRESAKMLRQLCDEVENLRLICADRDYHFEAFVELRAMFDWLEKHAISIRIQQNDRQSFTIGATREAIRFEMTAGNVDLPNAEIRHEPAERTEKAMSDPIAEQTRDTADRYKRIANAETYRAGGVAGASEERPREARCSVATGSLRASSAGALVEKWEARARDERIGAMTARNWSTSHKHQARNEAFSECAAELRREMEAANNRQPER